MYALSKMKIAIAKKVFGFVEKPIPIMDVGAGRVAYISEHLKKYGVDNVLVVTDKPLMSLGLLDPMLDNIKSSGIQVYVYDGITPDPTYTVVNEGLDMCRKNKCNGIIAFGGGSVLDSAKAISVAYANNTTPAELEGLLKVKEIGMPFIAVPTTSGTGSECTIVAVISDPVSHKKTTIIDPKTVPDYVILDSEITVGLPPHITSATTMDALTHGLESYISTYATSKTKRYAEICIKLIFENLEKVYNDPQNLEAREALLLASFYGGLAFTRTYVGYVHAFSHNIGAHFGVPHGLANAVLLHPIMKFSLPACEEKFCDLSKAIGIYESDKSVSENASAFVDAIKVLGEKVKIPKKLDKFPSSSVEQIRNDGFKECHGTYPVPRYLTKSEADEILKSISV